MVNVPCFPAGSVRSVTAPSLKTMKSAVPAQAKLPNSKAVSQGIQEYVDKLGLNNAYNAFCTVTKMDICTNQGQSFK